MKKSVLKRKPGAFMQKIAWLLLSGLWVVSRWDDRSAIFWGWLLLFIAYSISLTVHLLYPEIIVANGRIGFFQHKRKLWRWVSLPVNGIRQIIESERKAAGIRQTLFVPSFIFAMKEGNEFEYFPAEKPGKRLNEIIAILESIPGGPGVKFKPKGTGYSTDPQRK